MGSTSGWPEFSPADLEAAEDEDGVGIGVRESIMLVGLGIMGCVSWHSASCVILVKLVEKKLSRMTGDALVKIVLFFKSLSTYRWSAIVKCVI